MDQAVLADIEVTGTGAASPVVRNATSQIVLEPIEPAVAVLSVIPDLAEDAFLPAIQRLYGAAADRDDGGFQVCQSVDAPDHFIRWHRRRKIVVFVTVGASQIAFACGNDVSQNDVLGGSQSTNNHLGFSPPQLELVRPLHLIG